MTLEKHYKVLGLSEEATLADVKRTYRKLAFSLHPDLNPDLPQAAKRFQELNEAYVTLLKVLESGKTHHTKKSQRPSTAKAREEAHEAYKKAQNTQQASSSQSTTSSSSKPQPDMTQEDVLKDILNDPFARRVFEDIYSHIKHDDATRSKKNGQASHRPKQQPQPKKLQQNRKLKMAVPFLGESRDGSASRLMMSRPCACPEINSFQGHVYACTYNMVFQALHKQWKLHYLLSLPLVKL